jgi:hypothetical protein
MSYPRRRVCASNVKRAAAVNGTAPSAVTSKLEGLALGGAAATGLPSTDGSWRWRVACWNEYAIAISVASANGRPRSSMPTGNPPGVNPAGTFIAGNPVCGDSASLLPS